MLINENVIEDEIFFEKEAPKEPEREFINFFLNSEWYGIEMLEVREVLKPSDISFLPGAPNHIMGIINLRGSILPVADLKKLVSIGGECASLDKSRILVVEHNRKTLGLLVDSIGGTKTIPVSRIDPPMATLDGPAAGYIEGESEIDGKLLGILKVEKLFENN